jgi:hypothetical protein
VRIGDRKHHPGLPAREVEEVVCKLNEAIVAVLAEGTLIIMLTHLIHARPV